MEQGFPGGRGVSNAGNDDNANINLFAFAGYVVFLIRRYLWVLSAVIILAGVCGVAYSLMQPNIYESEIIVMPRSQSGDRSEFSQGLDMLSGFVGGAGFFGGKDQIETYLAIMKTGSFLGEFIEKNNLMPILFPKKWDKEKGVWKYPSPEMLPKLVDGIDVMKRSLSVTNNARTKLVVITFENENRQMTAKILELLVADINKYLQDKAIRDGETNIHYLQNVLSSTPELELRQVLNRMIGEQLKNNMLAKTSADYEFQTIDPPRVPERKVRPKRLFIVLITVVVTTVIALFVLALREYILNGRRYGDFRARPAAVRQ